jgi:hypothetical protein
MVIAVYEREDDSFDVTGGKSGAMSLDSQTSSASRLLKSTADYSRRGGGGGGGRRPPKQPTYTLNQNPGSVPEPATIVIFSLGSLLMANQKHRKKN